MDDPANRTFVHRFNIVSLPSLGMFRRGGSRPVFVVGVQEEAELLKTIEGFRSGTLVAPAASVWRHPPGRYLWPD